MNRILMLLACLLLLSASPAPAQSGANVLLVINEASADSGRIAEHYARVRSVPSGQVLPITVDNADEIERAVFDAQIQTPIATWLLQHAAQDRILYIVLTKGIPLRIKGTPGRDGTVASVDSELTLLYGRLVGRNPTVAGMLANPYFLGSAPVSQARTFSHEMSDLYLVTRLDGYTVEDVIGLVDRGAAPAGEGRILLDQKVVFDDPGGNEWLEAAADRLTKSGFGDRVVLETSSWVLSGEKNVLATCRASTWLSRSTWPCATSAGRPWWWATRCARHFRARCCSHPTSTKGSIRSPSCRRCLPPGACRC
jgi:uncharacterized protein (TIGR03790 family)